MSRRLDWDKARRQEGARREPESSPTVAWWWTIAKYGGRCSGCHELIPKDATVAYSHAMKSAMCEVCADELGLSPSPSKAFLAKRKASKKQKKRGRR